MPRLAPGLCSAGLRALAAECDEEEELQEDEGAGSRATWGHDHGIAQYDHREVSGAARLLWPADGMASSR